MRITSPRRCVSNEHQQHMFNEELTKIIFQLLSNNIKYTLYLSGLLHFSCMTVGFYYTPGIYAEGYIVFVFPFVRSYVRSFVCSFVRTSFRHVEFASKFCVKVSQVVYISATTH